MVRVTDCVNGSLIPNHHFGAYTNITSIIRIFHVSTSSSDSSQKNATCDLTLTRKLGLSEWLVKYEMARPTDRLIQLFYIMLHCKDKTPKFRNKYSQTRNIGVSVPISTFMRLWVIYIFPWSVCLFCWRKYVDKSWDYINSSQTHECGNWGWGRAIPRKGTHKWVFRCSVYSFCRQIDKIHLYPSSALQNVLRCVDGELEAQAGHQQSPWWSQQSHSPAIRVRHHHLQQVSSQRLTYHSSQTSPSTTGEQSATLLPFESDNYRLQQVSSQRLTCHSSQTSPSTTGE